jgi:cysteine sulfinate desulfinase/cysteine desulfurase-like protein
MGIPREWSLGGLRISLGYHTSEQDIDRVIESLPMCVERVRKAVLDF